MKTIILLLTIIFTISLFSCDKQNPKSNQYEFYRIELTPVNYEPYRTKHNYKVDEGGGWTSDSPVFCKDGIYYAILT